MTTWAGVTALVLFTVAGCGIGESPPGEPAAQSPQPSPTQTRAVQADPGPSRDEASAVGTEPWHAPLPEDFTWPEPSSPPSPQSGAAPRGTVSSAEVDRGDPKAVAKAFVRAVYSSDFRADSSRADAAQRAVPFTSGELRKAMATEQEHRPGLVWMELQRAAGWVKVTAEDVTEFGAEQEPDPQRAESSWLVTLDYQGADLPRETFILHLTLTQRQGEWSVAGMRPD